MPETNIEKNKLKFSKNDINTSLFSILNNYMIIMDEEKKKENVKKKYKNLYYVDDITKKILTLLYFHEIKMRKKIENDIKDIS